MRFIDISRNAFLWSRNINVIKSLGTNKQTNDQEIAISSSRNFTGLKFEDIYATITVHLRGLKNVIASYLKS